jgi:hypothetical protein
VRERIGRQAGGRPARGVPGGRRAGRAGGRRAGCREGAAAAAPGGRGGRCAAARGSAGWHRSLRKEGALAALLKLAVPNLDSVDFPPAPRQTPKRRGKGSGTGLTLEAGGRRLGLWPGG